MKNPKQQLIENLVQMINQATDSKLVELENAQTALIQTNQIEAVFEYSLN